MRQSPSRTESRSFWPMFVIAAGVLAISAGFLLGGSLFLVRMSGGGYASWQAAAIQAHGHVQLFGWGGLMVLGIGLHFLPRLFSVRIPHPSWPLTIFVLMVSGLVLRALCQPASVSASAVVAGIGIAGLLTSSIFELIAALMTAWLIGTLLRRRMTASRRVPSVGVTALIGIAFSSFLIAVFLNVFGSIQASSGSDGLIPFATDNGSVTFGLVGFLVAVSIAMSARLFPLYVQTKLPREQWLRLTALTIAASVILRSLGTATQRDVLTGIGELSQGVSFLSAVVALRVFETHWRMPRRHVRIAKDPLQLHVISAYIWLVVAGIFALIEGLQQLGIDVWNIPPDAQLHAIGTGFITVLILGVGAEMLPGFARTPLRWPRARWMTLVLANVATLLRVVPLVSSGISSLFASATMASAGAFGAAAITLFLINIQLKIRVGETANRRSSQTV